MLFHDLKQYGAIFAPESLNNKVVCYIKKTEK